VCVRVSCNHSLESVVSVCVNTAKLVLRDGVGRSIAATQYSRDGTLYEDHTHNTHTHFGKAYVRIDTLDTHRT